MAAALVTILILLSLTRPIDHDESQYVAAAALVARGLLPYRDFAYLQTPLQPLLFAPIAWLAGVWSWTALRIANALLGALAILAVRRAAQIGGASARTATIVAALFASTDILLFAIGTARNDALPAACLAVALPAILRTANARARRLDALAIGFLLASAAAAKISYALPALAYGTWTLFNRTRRPWWTVLGAAPLVALVAATWLAAPAGFVFGVFTFPARAPAEWYAARPWKLSLAAKAVDTLKFLALGPALLALFIVVRQRGPHVLAVLILAGLVAALMPEPTWRQYLLPILPPLFVTLALAWEKTPPARPMRIAAMVFACAGFAPSLVSTIQGKSLADARRQTVTIRTALDRANVAGPVATLSPQFLPGRAIDPRFAPGPFYFRSTALLDARQEHALHLVSQVRPEAIGLPPAILTGGEGAWTSGDDGIDRALADYAVKHGYRAMAAGRFTLWIRPPRVSLPAVPRNTP